MKKIFLSGLFVLTLFACEEEIDVNLPAEDPRLVVEADILWEKGSNGNEQTIRLTRSSEFFDESEPEPVANADIQITNLDSGEEVEFEHEGNGEYTTTDFVPVLMDDYRLTVAVGDVVYSAEETMIPMAELLRIEQNAAQDFEGNNVVSIDAVIQDFPEEENFYLARHNVNNELRPFLSLWDDQFQNGNEISVIYREYFTDSEDAELLPGDEIEITLSGISKEYANYMYILTEQFYQGGDPFSTVPVQLKGNVLPQSEEMERAYGYFRLSETVTEKYRVE